MFVGNYGPARIRLWAANIIVVLVELILEAGRKGTLCSCQRVRPTRTNIVNARDTVNGLPLQECICISDCLQDAGARERAIRKIQLRSQQVTRQTANCIIRFGAAAVHGFEDLSYLCDRVHIVVAQGFWQVLDGPRSVRTTTAAQF